MAKGRAQPGILAPIEGPVMGVINAIPIAQVQTWVFAYFHPMETFAANRKNSNFGSIIINLILVGLVAWLGATISASLKLGLGYALLLLFGIVAYPAVVVIGSLILSAIYWVVARALGGRGSYTDQTYAFSLLSGGQLVLAFPFLALSTISFAGTLLLLVAWAIGIYNIYNLYLAIMGIHKLSSGRSIVVLVLPLVIAGVLAFVLAATVAAVVAGLFGGAVMGGMGY